jgi:hypothetical protein
MRLLGLDTATRNHADDDELGRAGGRRGAASCSTRDRGLLRRRAVVAGGVRAGQPGRPAGYADVLDALRPRTAPVDPVPDVQR